MPGTVDGRDASFFIEKWYRHLIGQDYINPQGGIDVAVWLQKIWGYYTYGAGNDLLYDGRSDEFWASMILATNPTLIVIPPPTISDAGYSVSDAEAIGFDVGTPTATGDALTWAITAGNSAGKFTINAATGLIELAAALNFWNTASYSLTVQVTNAGGSDTATITITVTSVYSVNVRQYLKLNETSGTDALDYSAAGTLDGVYSAGVTVASSTNPLGDPVPLADGITGRCNIYSAALVAAFNGAKGTVSLYFKAFEAAYWNDVVIKYLVAMFADGNNSVAIYKDSATNRLAFRYAAGGTVKTVTAAYSATTWTHLALTWNKAGDQMIAYVNGAQVGSIQTGLGTFAGSLVSTVCTLFTANTSGAFPSKVYMSRYRLFDEALPAAVIAKLALEFP